MTDQPFVSLHGEFIGLTFAAHRRPLPARAADGYSRMLGRDVAIRSTCKLCERRFLREVSGSCADVRRNPIGKRNLFRHVTSRLGVHLQHLRKAMRWEASRRSDKRRPQSPMDKRDPSLDQTAHKNIVTVPNRSRHREDFVTFLVRPPAASHWFPGDGLSNRRDRPPSCFEHDTMLTDERESLA